MQTVSAGPGILFGSFLYRPDLHSESELKEFWEAQFGPSFALVPKTNPLKDYYSKEMGKNLNRVFLGTCQVFPRDFLLSTKLQALIWEKNWSRDNKRMVNIDIGFLTPENFVLATTKNYSHRIFIGQNIYADLTYYFHQGELLSLPWTYPDYLDEEKKEYFLWMRAYLLQTYSV